MSQKSATIALIDNGKVLLLKRGDTAPWQPNKYCLVGGGVDDKESLLDAAVRETEEEVGISLARNSVKDIVISYNNGYSKIVFFCFLQNANIILNYEHSYYNWFDYSSCLKLYKQNLLVPRLIRTLSVLHDSKIIH